MVPAEPGKVVRLLYTVEKEARWIRGKAKEQTPPRWIVSLCMLKVAF